MSNVLIGIIPSNTSWAIFTNPERTTDNDFNNYLYCERTGASIDTFVTWTLSSLKLISSSRIKLIMSSQGSPSTVIWAFQYYNNTSWTDIFTGSSSLTDSTILDIDRIDTFLPLIQSSAFRFKVNNTSGNNIIDLLINEVQIFDYTSGLIVSDTTDDYSLSEDLTWYSKILPLPKGLRVFK